MTEQNKTKVPAELIPAGNYPVVSTDAVMDKQKGKTQEEVNTEAGEKIAALEESVGTGGSVDTRIENAVNTEKTRAENVEAQLSNEIDVLQKQDVVPVDSLPSVADADPKKIYRVVGTTSYTDYMVDTMAEPTAWKTLATYSFPGIDDTPTAGSEKLVKSGGVFNSIKEVTNEVEGGELNVQLTEDNIFTGYYINAGNAVLYTTSSGVSVAIYNISPNSRLNINIPKSGNSAVCSIGYSNNNTLEALTQTRSLSPDTNYMGTSSPQTIDTTSPSNKEYLLVCFTTTGGVPTVNVIEDSIPQVVRVDEIEYPNEAQEQARNNIGAASQEEVDDISEKCLGTYAEVEETLIIGKTVSNYYISAIADTYGIPRVKEGWNTVFYSIRNGEDLNISIPKTCNSAAFSLAYADESMINGWSSVNPCHVIDGTKGTSGSKTYNVINSDNYPYLMVCYDVAGGLPTVTGTYEEISTLPVLVSTLPINYTDAQKEQARENIGAASQEEVRKHSIKVLLIGSSHGVNSFAQFPTMAYQAGVNIIAGNYYRGGGLTSQVAADCNDNATLSGVQYSKFTNGEWSTKSVTKMEQILTDERWDIICLMRAASQCTTWTESMESDYDTIIAYITEKCDWSPKLTYMSGFADVNQYGHESDELIWTTAQNAKTKYGMEIVPMQPIIKICRDNPTLHDLGTYDYTDPSTGVTRHIGLLTCDGQHLDQGIGMYVGGCVSFNFYLKVFGMNVLTNNHLPTPANGLIPGWYREEYYTPITENYAKIIRQIVSVYFASYN